MRPYEIALSVPPDKAGVADRSQAIPVWSTEIAPRPFTPPDTSGRPLELHLGERNQVR